MHEGVHGLSGGLDEHWGDAAPATRRNQLAIVKSFFRFCVDERDLAVNPADKIKPPKKANVERQAYSPDKIEQLRMAQPTLREQIAVRLLGRLGLRKNELRLLKISDFDLTRGTFLVHGKGGKVVVMPIAFPKWSPRRPLDPSALHLHFKKWLERAGLPATVKMHELRHSAARTGCLNGSQGRIHDNARYVK